MSPSAALHDPVFRAYLGIVLGVLLVAGVVLALLQAVFRIESGSIWKTYRSWLWLAPLAALAIFVGRVPFIVGVIALALIAGREFARVAGLARDRAMSGAVSAAIGSIGIAAVFVDGFEIAMIGSLVLLASIAVLRNRRASAAGIAHPGDAALRSLSLGVLAFVLLGWMFGQLAFLANSANAYGYLCFLLFATELSDVIAFTVGRTLGRRALCPAISPRKTWEGALGALLLSLALPWLLWFSFPFFGPCQLILTGLIVGIGGPLGDLSLSLIKRDLGAKDWSAAIPGHGGVLDRIDSLIFVAPLFFQMTEHYYPGR